MNEQNDAVDAMDRDLRQREFHKDTETHHIPQAVRVSDGKGGFEWRPGERIRNVDDDIRAIEQALNIPTVLTAELPLAVKKFTAEIQTNFERTARRLEETALAMESRAAMLRSKANDLREAGPDVAAITERWIQYERDSAEYVKYYAPVFNK